MGLETATYIADLDAANPTGLDPRSEGDNHLRMIKEVLQNTFPGADGAGAAAVQFTPAGTGAVPTNVQSKLREFVSVKDFGASPSATAAVNSASFAAAWAASNPLAVYVPAATYAFTGTVTGKFYSFGAVTISGGTVTSITNLVP